MALALYLDDCAYAHTLRELLQADGHAVIVPADVGLSGVDDPVHFRHACANGLITVTKNPSDFLAEHENFAQSYPSVNHPGIFAVYQDNDAQGDMSYAQIVAAINYLEQLSITQGVPLDGRFYALNDWRPPPDELARQAEARRQRAQATASVVPTDAAEATAQSTPSRPRGKRK